MSSDATYELATARWRRTPTVQIVSILDTEIADFPVSFLASCGDNTWQYVLDVVHQLVDPAPEHPGVICMAHEKQEDAMEPPVALGGEPTAGIFRYKQLGESFLLLLFIFWCFFGLYC